MSEKLSINPEDVRCALKALGNSIEVIDVNPEHLRPFECVVVNLSELDVGCKRKITFLFDGGSGCACALDVMDTDGDTLTYSCRIKFNLERDVNEQFVRFIQSSADFVLGLFLSDRVAVLAQTDV